MNVRINALPLGWMRCRLYVRVLPLVEAVKTYLYTEDDENGNVHLFALNLTDVDDGSGNVTICGEGVYSETDDSGNVALVLR